MRLPPRHTIADDLETGFWAFLILMLLPFAIPLYFLGLCVRHGIQALERITRPRENKTHG